MDLEEDQIKIVKEFEVEIFDKKLPKSFLGSEHWIKEAQKNNKTIKGIINLDGVGYISKKKNSQQFPEGFSMDIFKQYKTDTENMVGNFVTVIFALPHEQPCVVIPSSSRIKSTYWNW